MNGWILDYQGFDPASEGLREALCTLGNGYFATRGAAEEASADDVHYPGTYLAAGYDRLETEVAERSVENEDLVNWPNWLCLSFRPEGGEWLDLRRLEVLEYRQQLDLAHGLLLRSVRVRDGAGRETRLESRRLVHMGEPHLAALESSLCAENWSGRVEVRSALDGRVQNRGVERYRDLRGDHLRPVAVRRVGEDGILLQVRTRQSGIQMAQAARTRAFADGERAPVDRDTRLEPGLAAQALALEVSRGRPIRVEKVVALYTSRDRAIADCASEASRCVEGASDFAELAATHERAWARLWRRCDVDVDCEEGIQLVLRLHVFHLLQTVSMHNVDLDAGVPARGLHGEAYRGHVFWDELFVFPFLNLRVPAITRSLLLYRYRRLPEARRAARAAGLRGALYPWQSGSNGREESQQLHLNPRSGRWLADHSHLQRHIGAAIAYNVWQYHQATGEDEFLWFYGAELILEIALLWSSLARWDAELERFVIRGVVGPDEYHDAYPGAERAGIDNNAYTNVMAVWVLRRACEVLELLPPHRRAELREALALSDGELARWDEVSRRMFVPFHDGLISQFEGYERLAELDWPRYRRLYADIQRLDRILEAEGDSANRYKISKQADVLMLFYLFSAEELSGLFAGLGYPFPTEAIPRNVQYYLERTCDGSTLSGVAHAWVLSRSDRARAWRYFERALASDFRDVQGGTTAEGIHLGAMAGTVDIVQRCYTGLEVRGDVLWLNPHLPGHVRGQRLRIRYRGHWLRVEVRRRSLRVELEQVRDRALRIGVRDEVYDLRPGEVREFQLAAAGPRRKAV